MRFKIDWASLIVGRKFTVFALFYSVFEGNFQVQAPGGLYLEGRFNGGFFALRVCLWAYIWRGLYMEGFIFRILRYLDKSRQDSSQVPFTSLGPTTSSHDINS